MASYNRDIFFQSIVHQRHDLRPYRERTDTCSAPIIYQTIPTNATHIIFYHFVYVYTSGRTCKFHGSVKTMAMAMNLDKSEQTPTRRIVI